MYIGKPILIMIVCPQGTSTSATVNLVALIYDPAGTLYTTSTFSVPVNKYFSIPSLRGNLVQLQIINAAQDIEAIEVQE